MDSELGRLEESVDWACAEIDRLRVQRAELLAALKRVLVEVNCSTKFGRTLWDDMRVIIAKAEEEGRA